MSHKLVLTNKFKRALKSAKKRGLDITLLEALVDTGSHADLFNI